MIGGGSLGVLADRLQASSYISVIDDGCLATVTRRGLSHPKK